MEGFKVGEGHDSRPMVALSVFIAGSPIILFAAAKPWPGIRDNLGRDPKGVGIKRAIGKMSLMGAIKIPFLLNHRW